MKNKIKDIEKQLSILDRATKEQFRNWVYAALPAGTRRQWATGVHEKQSDGSWIKITDTGAEEGEDLPDGEIEYITKPFQDFIQVRDVMIPTKYKAFVTEYTQEQYADKGANTFISESGKSGYAIAEDGDLISVFSAKGAKEGDEVIENAIRNGATKLDCLSEKLRKKYESHGFEVDRRESWSDEFAPPGWDYEEFDKPDIIYMKIKGGEAMEQPEKIEKQEPNEKQKPTPETSAFKKLAEDYVNDTFGEESAEEIEAE